MSQTPPLSVSFYARWGRWIMVVALVLVPVVGWGVIKATETNNNNIKQWLPDGMEATEVYQEFRRHFGTDEFALVTWDGCTLDDPRLEQYAELAEQATTADGQPMFSQAITGPRLVQSLIEAPFDEPLDEEQAVERLTGLLIGPSGQTCCVVKLSEAGDRDRTAVMHKLYELGGSIGLGHDQIHLGGDAIFNAIIDVESARAIDELTLASVVVALVVALSSLRSVKMTVFVLMVAAYGGALSQALVYFTGSEMNLVLVILPVLVYILTLSAGVHVANYYREAVARGGPSGAVVRAVQHGWVPCLLASLTTAVGLISLTVSHVEPVRLFGIYGALGVATSLVFVFLLLPSLLERWPLRIAAAQNDDDDTPYGPRIDAAVRKVAAGVISLRAPILIVGIGAMLVLGWHLGEMNTSVKPIKFFSPDSDVVRDAIYLEDHLGAMIPIEVVLVFDNRENHLSFPQRLSLVDRVQQQITDMDLVGGTLSAATFAPHASSESDGTWTPAVFKGAAQRVRQRRLRGYFEKAQWLSIERDEAAGVDRELWRISARVKAHNDVPYDVFTRQVQKRVGDYLAGQDPSVTAGLQVRYTGAIPLFYTAQTELLEGLMRSFVLAFALIGVVMIVLLRSVGAGLAAMIPNVFPAVLVFGWMAWRGVIVDVGAMLTASVAMGIAVDDTLHFLTWFRRGLREGRDRQRAIVYAYRRCAIAMSQTTAIAGLGLLVFAYSDFLPVSKFGLLMFLMLLLALVGDLVVLPALLASGIGRMFEVRLPAAEPKPEEQLVT